MSDLKEITENARQEMIAAGVDGWPNVVLWQQERIEELERRWDDLPWEEIEGVLENDVLDYGLAILLRDILKLRSQSHP